MMAFYDFVCLNDAASWCRGRVLCWPFGLRKFGILLVLPRLDLFKRGRANGRLGGPFLGCDSFSEVATYKESFSFAHTHKDPAHWNIFSIVPIPSASSRSSFSSRDNERFH